MGTTPNFNLRYPNASDAPDGPGGIFNLAIDTDTLLATLSRKTTAWTSYVPNGGSASSVTNFGGGNSSSAWYWRYVAGEVEIKGGVTLGSSGASCSGDVTIGLPVAALIPTGQGDVIGAAKLVDVGNAVYVGVVGMASNNSVYIHALSVSGAHTVETALSATNPMTWGPGDILTCRFRYTPAS